LVWLEVNRLPIRGVAVTTSSSGLPPASAFGRGTILVDSVVVGGLRRGTISVPQLRGTLVPAALGLEFSPDRYESAAVLAQLPWLILTHLYRLAMRSRILRAVSIVATIYVVVIAVTELALGAVPEGAAILSVIAIMVASRLCRRRLRRTLDAQSDELAARAGHADELADALVRWSVSVPVDRIEQLRRRGSRRLPANLEPLAEVLARPENRLYKVPPATSVETHWPTFVATKPVTERDPRELSDGDFRLLLELDDAILSLQCRGVDEGFSLGVSTALIELDWILSDDGLNPLPTRRGAPSYAHEPVPDLLARVLVALDRVTREAENHDIAALAVQAKPFAREALALYLQG
jgi:hypothetical protein